MTKVTYLFGAGASANALPLVNELPKRMNELADHWIKGENRNKNLLLSENEFFSNFPSKSKREYQNQLLDDMKWLSTEAAKHASVDTLAKKFFLKGTSERKNLWRLKNALSMFFIFEQTRFPADIRYDSFFASILNGHSKGFPENIKILTWNYDYQFEKAYSEYSGWSDLEVNQNDLKIISKHSQVEPPMGFAIVKLNGTTAFSDRSGSHILEPLSNITVQLNIETVNALANYYAAAIEAKEGYYPLLSFAWEGEGSKGKTIVDKAIACAKDTEVLVVIGYSFPFFNREVDRKIIGAMKDLKKVYFQAPDAENIKTRFQAVRGKDLQDNSKDGMPYPELVAYPEVGSFLLPDEL